MQALRVAAVALVLGSCSAHCPGTQVLPDPKNPYAVARFAVQGAQLALYGADALFNLWASTTKDPVKVAETTARYNMVRAAVTHGLSLALRAIDIAEKLKAEVDIKALLKDADLAWQDLRALIAALKPEPVFMATGSVVHEQSGTTSAPTSVPAPAPALKADARAPKSYKVPSVKDLPKSLLP